MCAHRIACAVSIALLLVAGQVHVAGQARPHSTTSSIWAICPIPIPMLPEAKAWESITPAKLPHRAISVPSPPTACTGTAPARPISIRPAPPSTLLCTAWGPAVKSSAKMGPASHSFGITAADSPISPILAAQPALRSARMRWRRRGNQHPGLARLRRCLEISHRSPNTAYACRFEVLCHRSRHQFQPNHRRH